MTRVKIAVAGVGAIGRRHIELIQASAACDLVAVVDPVAADPAYLASLGVAQFSSLGELFAQQLPDGVILATPNALHVQQAIECIEAKVAALVEKPLAHSVAEGRRLAELATQAQARILVGHHRAHSPTLARARQIIGDGLLGDLVAVQGSALFYKPDTYFDAAPWRRQLGGGPILINLIHEIGNLRSLCGEVVAVQALQSNAARGFPVEDTVAISLRFANGMLGSFMLSDSAACARSWEQTSQENTDYAFYDDEDCYVISGKQGSLSVPTLRLKTYPGTEDRSWFTPFECSTAAVQPGDPLALQLEHFCAVIRGEVAPLVTVDDGLRNLIVVEAIAEAARTGALITIE
ncbi:MULTISPECIES: Gfo/Idh/MocA family oxidoreductase [Pseudomonas]|uniref:Dehydrogenase n=1 Tax=Pseudomonas hunanensis TaxID=1247546 RepID=A0ACC6K5P1_9PSED|nr:MULTISPECIES: Gfo/Idh/MocA family oxidoreductase [Pseudomonas]MBP2261847.1 putative dehydrogenase [Pseudomonas sp. BP8]MDR6713732.1 putative dehydrogenase [Pseudomonas hunanensis]HDS1737112.1 Gfo/Idh/MocA family oxidoreductase [Pseudomonas putida]